VEVVGVEEGPALALGEKAAHRGLAHSRHAHEDDDHGSKCSLGPGIMERA
jgi:hypothetical protein